MSLEDLYTLYKKLQRQLEFLQVQEEYIKYEQKNLKREYLHAQEEVKRIRSVPLVIGQFLEAVDQVHGIVGSTTGTLHCRIDCNLSWPGRLLSLLMYKIVKINLFFKKFYCVLNNRNF